MAREHNRLPSTYKKLKPGLHADGGNLYLQITLGAEDNRRLSWIFRFALKGQKARDMGLGSVNDISMAEAREIAREYRNLVKRGIDPIEHRKADVAKNLAAHAKAMSFDEAAEAYIRQHQVSWKNAKHAWQWKATLKAYASPKIGRLPVSEVSTAHIMKVVEPIWQEKPETASRLRGRMEAVLGWATVSGHRSGDNPARWEDHLDQLLPSPSKVRAVVHQPALPYSEMPAFMVELRQERTGIGALALEFAVLTLVRTIDVRNAEPAHIDVANGAWTIPSFSKVGGEHRVPLSPAAIAVYEKAQKIKREIGGKAGASRFAFPNDVTGERLSENALTCVIKRMGRKGQMTTHGCRATFRTWAQESTSFPWELCELSLGHKVGDKVARAYARGDGFRKRVRIMQAWADFCARPPASTGDIVPIRGVR